MGSDMGVMGDLAAGEGLDQGTDVTTDIGNDVVVDEGADAGFSADEGGGTDGGELSADGEQPEAKEQEAGAEAKGDKEVLPAALSKAIRELKQANPEQAPALKTLNNAYFKARAYEQVYASPEEARTDKAALEAVGGPSGISEMQASIDQIDAFDNMAKEGNPRVIEGLADQFPDGFKRLVPVAIDRLSKADPEAYRETMRGPLLQMLEGDGVIDVIGAALEELKAAVADPQNTAQGVNRAQRELGRIAKWYNDLTNQQKEFKGRYQDPKLKELETERASLRQQQSQFQEETVRQDLISYVNQSLTPEIGKILNGKTLQAGGRTRFESNVKQEISNRLKANPNYGRGLRALISQGKRAEAVNFAMPFIDQARRGALTSVFTDLYGSAPANQQRRPATNGQQQRPANGQQQSQATDKPIPVRAQPPNDQIDWDKDPKRLLFITNKAFLKGSGKLVAWK